VGNVAGDKVSDGYLHNLDLEAGWPFFEAWCILAHKHVRMEGSAWEELLFSFLKGYFHGCWYIHSLRKPMVVEQQSYINSSGCVIAAVPE